MGVKRASYLFASHPTQTLEFDTNTTYLVDVLGSFYPLLIKSPHPAAFWAKVKALFPENVLGSVVFVMDGQPSIAKAMEANRRAEEKKKALRKLELFVEKITQRRRIPRSVHYRLRRLLRGCFHVDSQMKNDLFMAGITAGLRLFQASGEADLAIATLAASSPTCVIITKDSDLLFHRGVNRVFLIRSYWKGKMIYPATLLEPHGLSPVYLPLVAAISGCDYSPNLKGIGIAGSLKVLKNIQDRQLDVTLGNYVNSIYERHRCTHVQFELFEYAIQVYLFQLEMVIPEQGTNYFELAKQILGNFYSSRQIDQFPVIFQCQRNQFASTTQPQIRLINHEEYFEMHRPPPPPLPSHPTTYLGMPDLPSSHSLPAPMAIPHQPIREREDRIRAIRQATADYMALQGRQKTITMKVGLLGKKIKKTSAGFLQDRTQRETVTSQILSRIRSVVQISKRVKVASQLATHFFIVRHHNSDWCRLLFTAGFWQNLLKFCYRGVGDVTNDPVVEVLNGGDLPAINDTQVIQRPRMCAKIVYFLLFGTRRLVTNRLPFSMVHVWENFAVELKDAFCNHLEKLNELEAKLRELDITIPTRTQNLVQSFYNVNSLLPVSDQWRYCPLSSHVESHVMLTERALIDLSYSINGMRALWQKLVLPSQSVTQVNVAEAALESPGVVIQTLIWNPWCDYSSGHSRRVRNGKVIVGKTIRTDGFDLQITAYSMKHGRNDQNVPINMDELATPPALVLGIDLGERYTIGATCIYASSTLKKSYVKTKKCFMEPVKRHRRWLEARKGESQVARIETTMVNSNSLDPIQFMEYVDKRLGAQGDQLDAFYSSTKMKYRKWMMKQASQREYDLSVESLLDMMDLKSGSRGNSSGAIVAMGDAKFDGDPTSLHLKFRDFLFLKLKSIGVPFAAVDEYNTSQFCPKCFERIIKPDMRVTFCESCSVHFHRDKMAGENIAIACQETANGNERPACFRRPE